MTKTLKKLQEIRKKLILELRKPTNIILILIAGGFIFITGLFSFLDREKVLDNPIETEATILKLKPCFKNGKCIDFRYSFNGGTYEAQASTSWEFFKWCKNNNGCRGMKFKLIHEKDNPENILVYWEEMYKREAANNNFTTP